MVNFVEGKHGGVGGEGMRQMDVNKSGDSVWYKSENVQADDGIQVELAAQSKRADEITGHVGGQT